MLNNYNVEKYKLAKRKAALTHTHTTPSTKTGIDKGTQAFQTLSLFLSLSNTYIPVGNNYRY